MYTEAHKKAEHSCFTESAVYETIQGGHVKHLSTVFNVTIHHCSEVG